VTAVVGHGALLAAAAACAVAVVASLSDRVDAGARALQAATVFLGVALAALAWALLTGDYTLEYVARATSRSMSWPYRLGSLWSGMEGSLLLWSWLLAMGTAAAVASLRRSTALAEHLGTKRPLDGRFVPSCGGVLVGAATLLLLTLADPFARLSFPALDGAGLTPILEHPALLYHPPILYLGQTLLAVPFAVTVAALLRGRLDDVWLAVARRFALVAWVALTAGMVAGAHWAYQELGWGGFWAWDPVENASLMPWLATTAFLHSAVVTERRGRWQNCTAGWALAAFALALVGAYLTRSGATGSVHAFAEARAIGIAFLAAVAVVVIGGALLLGRRRRQLGPEDAGRSGGGDQSAPKGVATRETALLVNNALLFAALVVVAAGTLAPSVSKPLGRNEFLVAPRFFAWFTALPALVALALAGIGPSMPWSRQSPATLRSSSRRQLQVGALGGGLGAGVSLVLGLATPLVLAASAAAGVTIALSVTQAVRGLRSGRRGRALAAAVAHLGFALALFGIVGSTAGSETSGPIGPGQQVSLGRYRLVHEGAVEREGERRSSVRVQLGVFVGEHRLGTLRPGLDTYHGPGGSGVPLPETALRSTLREDLLVTAVRIDVDRGVAVVEIYRRPLVAWVWLGGILIAAGGALALRRPGDRRLVPEPAKSAMMEG